VAAVALPGCNPGDGEAVRLRYRSERWIHLAQLRTAENRVAAANATRDRQSAHDGWLHVVSLYDEALRGLDIARIERDVGNDMDRELVSLTLRAQLGVAAALREAGETQAAFHAYRLLLARALPYEGTRARAALGLAEVKDKAGAWDEALEHYRRWIAGVERGEWPLHERGIDVPAYVSRRLGDRAQERARRQWVDLASSALDAAARRGEHARDAHYARFLVLLDAEYWDAAYGALQETQAVYDPQGQSGGLTLAKANMLANAFARPDQALGLLIGLYSDETKHDVEYRVAGLLLSGQIELRQGRLDAATAHYERALATARSSMGRAEATLGLARVHTARGELDLARRRYTQLREAYASTPAGLLAPLEEYKLLRAHGVTLEAEGVLANAVHDYRRVITDFGTELPALRAAGYMSEVLGLSGSWEHGVAFLDSISNAFATDPRAGSLLVRAARLSADRLADPERARRLLARVRERYPQSDLAVAVQVFEDSLSIGP
jgi:tetratricopeptide (TPR) repeat protein